MLLHADAVGGVFTYAVELARALAARRVEVVLATEGALLDGARRAALAGVPLAGRHEASFRVEWMDDPWDDVARAGAWLLDVESRERPDVVHLGGFAHGALPFRAPTLVVGHSCVASWWEAVRGGPLPPGWDRYRRAVRAGLQGAGAVAAPSTWMAGALARHHGPFGPVHVVPNGRDPARFPPCEKRPFVMGAGRLWDEAKGAATLAEAARDVPWPVCLAGETGRPGAADRGGAPGRGAEAPGGAARAPLDPDLEPHLDLAPGRLHLLGPLPEARLARWLGRAAVFAHPARYEPFGLAVLEAALAGCALVLGDVESLRENWSDAALFVPPGDAPALAAALRRLARDGPRREALAARARARALRLGPGALAERTLGLYRALLGRAAARPEARP